MHLPALALARALECSAASAVTTRLSIPTRDTSAAMRSSHLLARGQPRGYKPSAPSGLDHPGLRRMKRASSLRSQQTVTLRKQIQLRDHPRWLKHLLATKVCAPRLSAAHQSSREIARLTDDESRVSLCGGWPGAADKFAGAVGYCVGMSSIKRMPVTISGWIAIMVSMVMFTHGVTVVRSGRLARGR